MKTTRAWMFAGALALFAAQAQARSHDFDGDGRADLFWRNAQTGANTIWRSASNATQQPVVTVTNFRWIVVGAGDFDGDGRADLLWRNRSTGANTIWRSADNATQIAMPSTSLDWTVAGVGDFDNDGRDDILWRNLRTSANVIWRSGNATLQRAVVAVGLPWMVAGIGDFDGDGADDILWRNRTTGANVIWPAGLVSGQRVLAAMDPTRMRVEAIGDFDGDGFDDVMWNDLLASDAIVWHRGDPAASATFDAPFFDDAAFSGDFDGDGRDDIVWREHVRGGNLHWRDANAGLPGGASIAWVTNLAWTLLPYEGQPTDPAVFLVANTRVMAEGSSGPRLQPYSVYASYPSIAPISFAYTDPWEGADDLAFPAVAIAPGETTANSNVQVNGDSIPESNESFVVSAERFQGARPGAMTMAVELLNDDGITVWVEPGSIDEGDSTATLSLDIVLSRASTGPVSFTVATANRAPGPLSATAGADYVARSASMTIPAGQTHARFDVSIVGDTICEADHFETFDVVLSNVTGAIAVDNPATGTINDDENPWSP